MAKQTWMWLAAGLGYGAVNIGELLAAYPGGAEEIANDLGSSRLDEILTQKQADRLASSRPADFALRIAHIEGQDIHVLPFDDADYPDTLRRITNPPPVLFVKGDLALMNGRLSIGMVGARRPSAYGMEAVKAIGRGIALGGAIIVSGLAAGLDSEAHKAALAVNGPTVACIAFGHDHCYPAANRKLMEVIEKHGAVVSEYPLGTGPEKPYFLQRNRLIAGLAHGLVVVEARKHSGTMSTVNFAIDYGRDVFGVPGSIFSELSSGTNSMISEGAYVAASASDVLEVYGVSLKEEDPVKAAARQAREGQPTAAHADTPVWQQNVQRAAELARQDTPPRRVELPGQQTLAQAARRRSSSADSGADSVGRAVDNFRTLQREHPPTSDSELDARNRALDERVAAISDQVAIGGGRGGKSPQRRPQANADGVRPYEWNQVERLEKRDVENLSPARGRTQAPTGRQARPAAPARSQPVQRVDAVERIEPAQAPRPVWPTPPVQEEPPAHMGGAAPQQQTRPAAEYAPAPVRQNTGAAPEAPQREPLTPAHQGRVQAALAAVLSQATGRPVPPEYQVDYPPAEQKPYTPPAPSPAPQPQSSPQARPLPPPVIPETPDPYKAREDELVPPGDLLSDIAQRALGALGPSPTSLDEICEKSGLSSAEAMAALTELELAGMSRQLAGRQFIAADGV